MQSHISLPVSHINEVLLEQANDLLEKIKRDAALVQAYLDNNSETANAKWYREKLESLFLALTVLSTLSIVGLNIAAKVVSPTDLQNTLSSIATYTGYGSIVPGLLYVYFKISPDMLPISLKLFLKGYPEEVTAIFDNFKSTLSSLRFKTQRVYTGTKITELACASLDEIYEQFNSLSSTSINAAKACMAKLPAITGNLSTLFSATPRSKVTSAATSDLDKDDSNDDVTIPLLYHSQ